MKFLIKKSIGKFVYRKGVIKMHLDEEMLRLTSNKEWLEEQYNFKIEE